MSYFRLSPDAERARYLIIRVQITKDPMRRSALMKELRALMNRFRADRELEAIQSQSI